jgi:hypothetical protein
MAISTTQVIVVIVAVVVLLMILNWLRSGYSAKASSSCRRGGLCARNDGPRIDDVIDNPCGATGGEFFKGTKDELIDIVCQPAADEYTEVKDGWCSPLTSNHIECYPCHVGAMFRGTRDQLEDSGVTDTRGWCEAPTKFPVLCQCLTQSEAEKFLKPAEIY